LSIAAKKQPAPSIVTTPGEREIRTERVFDAPRERVWKAFTDPRLVAKWWGRGNKLVVERMEVERGGHWRYVEHGPDGVHGLEGRYREVTPPERLSRTFEWDGMPGYVIVETAVFEDLGDGRTRVVSTSLFHTAEERDGMLSSGMEQGSTRATPRSTACSPRPRSLRVSAGGPPDASTRRSREGGAAMPTVHKTIEIHAPVGAVFSFLTDPVNLPGIWPSMVEVAKVERTPEGGHDFDWTYKMAGLRFHGHSHTIEVERNRRVVDRNEGGIPSTFRWTYEQVGGGDTRVTLDVDYGLPRIFGALAAPMLRKMNEREAETLLANLKTRMEAPAHA
jgi:uncharacterized protein YndB with AHSA1/START domain